MSAIENLLKEQEEQELSTAKKARARSIGFWLILLIAPLPLLGPYLASMWQLDFYCYLPLVPLAVGAMAIIRSDGFVSAPRGGFTWLSIVFALLLIVGGGVTHLYWFAAVGFVIIASLCLASMGGPSDKSLLGVAIPLISLLRFPYGTDYFVLAVIRDRAASISSLLLDLLRIPHTVRGPIIQLVDREVIIRDHCGGILSVFAIAFIAFVFLSWARVRPWLFPVYAFGAFVIAVVSDTIRLTSVVATEQILGSDAAEGWGGWAIPVLAVLVIAGLLWSFHKLSMLLFQRVSVDGGEPSMNPLVRLWDRFGVVPANESTERYRRRLSESDGSGYPSMLSSPAMSSTAYTCFLGFAGLVFVISTLQVIRGPGQPAVSDADTPALLDVSEAMLSNLDSELELEYEGSSAFKPEASGESTSPPDSSGVRSDSWIAKMGEDSLQFTLRQPFGRWSELTEPYETDVWYLVNRDVVLPETRSTDPSEKVDSGVDSGNQSFAVARMRHRSDPSRSGYLVYSAIDSSGKLVEAPTEMGARLEILWQRMGLGQGEESGGILMLEAWLESDKRIRPEVTRKVEAEFIKVRRRVADLIANSGSPPVQQNGDGKSTL